MPSCSSKNSLNITLMCGSKFDEVSSRLKKGKLHKKDLPTINEAFGVIRAIVEDAARQHGMTYAEYVEMVRRIEQQKRDAENTNQAEDDTESESPQSGMDKEPKPDSSANSEEDACEPKPDGGDEKDGKNSGANKASGETIDGRKRPIGGKPKGEGKNAISDLASTSSPIAITGLPAGGQCPCCKHGTIHQVNPGSIGRIEVNATFTFHEYQVEKMRCNSCGQTVSAEVPPEVSEDHIKGASFDATAALLVMRHSLAIPNLRIETLNGWLGTPLSDSRQWDIMREAGKLLLPLYEYLKQYIADAAVQVLDDGWCRIICIHREIQNEIDAAERFNIKKDSIRTGINTTAVLGYQDGNIVVVYMSGRKHQGENAHDLNLLKSTHLDSIRMSDAATKATSTHPFPARDERGFVLSGGEKTLIDSRIHVAHCLTHLRNKFADLRSHAPELCSSILDIIGQIYDVEEEAKCNGLIPMERLSLHKSKSQPLVTKLQEIISAELNSKKWLPREPIGQALKYASDHFKACTAFLVLPGCPLDTNDAERAIIPVVRHRQSSYSYQTNTGALVGDISMSLAASALRANKNPIDYIAKCLEFKEDISTNPQLWLPWCYEERWKYLKQLRISKRESNPLKGFSLVHRRMKDLEDYPQPKDPSGVSLDAALN